MAVVQRLPVEVDLRLGVHSRSQATLVETVGQVGWTPALWALTTNPARCH